MIISEYIENPLLIEGKKFHLRIHFILSIIVLILYVYIINFLSTINYIKIT